MVKIKLTEPEMESLRPLIEDHIKPRIRAGRRPEIPAEEPDPELAAYEKIVAAYDSLRYGMGPR